MQNPTAGPFFDFRWGVERETHRMRPTGQLSLSKHPEALRAPAFTRDFAETQLEIVTSPARSISELMAELGMLTNMAQQIIAPELLWPFSIPPILPPDSEIQVAEIGPQATLYREGLALRYGKARQMICGVHLNVSFGDHLIDWLSQTSPLTTNEESYPLRLARNLYQELPYFFLLFGASPLLEGSTTLATSHRNGPAGYGRAGFLPYLDLSSLNAYVEAIHQGLSTESPEFMALGLTKDGRATQLNGNVFQTAKEFYAPIRLRQTVSPRESELKSLLSRGVGYLELRFLDVDPFHLMGISEEAIRLMHLFLLDNLQRPARPRGNARLREDVQRAAEAAKTDPLQVPSAPLFMDLERRLSGLEIWARRLDHLESGETYAQALSLYRAWASNPSISPSASLACQFQASGKSWTHFGIHTASLLRKGISHELDHSRV